MKNKEKRNFEILEYSRDNLAYSLSSKFFSPVKVKAKYHYEYLSDYFDSQKGGLDIKSILIEFEYFSQSYIDDYQVHHVMAHAHYQKYCKRIHFFQESPPKGYDNGEDIFIHSNHPDYKNFWNSYSGYITIRPIPSGLIGASLLKPYPSEGKLKHQRKFPTKRKYDINIFGVRIEDFYSLIYQEQDTLTGGCATSALWCTIHKLHYLFHSPLMSPSEITLAAGSSLGNTDRLLPNTGLEILQMRNAINSIGLEAEIWNSDEIESEKYVTGIIYSYLKLGIPVIVGIELEGSSPNKKDYHAVTVTGYEEINKSDIDSYFRRIKALLPITKSLIGSYIDVLDSDIHLIGEMGKKFYAHDDQIGPFSRLLFLRKNKIRTASWGEKNFFNKDKKNVGNFFSLFVVTPKIIRITYTQVRLQILSLNTLLKSYLDYEGKIYWDIYLSYSNDYKVKLRGNNYDPALQDNVIYSNLPEYIWIAEFYWNDIKIFDYLLDPTEINSSSSGIRFVYFRKKLFDKDTDYVNKFCKQLVDILLTVIKESPKREYKKKADDLLKIFIKLNNSLPSKWFIKDDLVLNCKK